MTSTRGGARGFGTFRPTPAPGGEEALPAVAPPPSVPTRRLEPPVGRGWSPWWARTRPEPAGAVEPCARTNERGTPCGAPPATPFDLYCGAPQAHFLVLGGTRWAQLTAVNGTRAVLGALVLLAAARSSPVPLYGVAAVVGLLVLALPLRLFRTSRIVAAVLWPSALGLAAAAREGWIAASLRDGVVEGVLAVVLAGLVAAVLLGGEERGDDAATRPLALALSTALALAVAAALLSLGVGDAGEPLRRALWLAALAALGSALSGAALAGFVRGVRRIHYAPPTIRMSRLTPPSVRARSRVRMTVGASRNPIERMAATLQGIVLGLARQLATAGERLLAIFYAVANGIAYATLWTAKVAYARTAWLMRLLAEAVRSAAAALTDTTLVLAAVAPRWARGSLLPVAVVAACAEGALVACRWFSAYLGGASVGHGVGALVLAVAVAAVLVVVWWALTGWPARAIADAAQTSASCAGASTFMTLVVLGWVDGIAGLLGAGPLRPGTLTYAGTAMLLVATLWVLATGRRAPAADRA